MKTSGKWMGFQVGGITLPPAGLEDEGIELIQAKLLRLFPVVIF